MIDWQPIETAPRDGTHILLWLASPAAGPMIGYWDRASLCWIDVYDSWDNELIPLHWAALVPPGS